MIINKFYYESQSEEWMIGFEKKGYENAFFEQITVECISMSILTWFAFLFLTLLMFDKSGENSD